MHSCQAQTMIVLFPNDPNNNTHMQHETRSWPTGPGSPERAKLNYAILQGPLIGQAIAIVESKGEFDWGLTWVYN